MDEKATIAGWISDIEAKARSTPKCLREEREKLKVEQPLRVWLGSPRSGYPLENHGPLLRDFLTTAGCSVELSCDSMEEDVIEASPSELARVFDVLFLVVASPGTSAEAMELALSPAMRGRLYVFVPEEYRKGYLARSLGDRHQMLSGLNYFALEAAKTFGSQLPHKMLKTLEKHRNLAVQEAGVQELSCTVKLRTIGNQQANMPSINIITATGGSTVVNQSTVEHAFNSVKMSHGLDAADALKMVAEHVGKSGNKEAGELLDAFNEELTKPAPKKSILKACWEKVCQLVPTVTELAKACAEITKLFTGGS